MRNSEIIKFQGSNNELCAVVGAVPGEDAPAHWANFTARAIRQKAAVAVADGRGEEEYIHASRGKRVVSAPAKKGSVYALPAHISALLPAMALRAGTNDLRDFILKNSTPATNDKEAELPGVITDVLAFFGYDLHSNWLHLLSYAGVKTLRTKRIETIRFILGEITQTLDELSDEGLASVENIFSTILSNGE